MNFNPDPSKQAQEVIFSRKIKKPTHPVLISNNNHVIQTPYRKHLGLILDEKLNFGEHLRYIANKFSISIGLLRNLQKALPRRSLITIKKSFTRPHLDYGDVIFDQTYNNSFRERLESSPVQCFINYNWSNKRYFKGKTLPRTSFRIFSAQALFSQTLHFLQDF